jgi:hypothetical protein
MALTDFSGLLFGSGGSGLEGYLTPEQQSNIQNQAMLQAASALLAAGGPRREPISVGQALGGALQAGQAGYQQAQQGAIQNLLVGQKLQEAQRLKQMRELYPQIFKETEGGITIDPNKLQALTALSSNPLETLAAVSKLVPDLRRAGFLTTGVQENPFTIFTQDATIPDSLRRVAQQYESSYAKGLIDPEKADERVRQLGSSIQSAQQFAQTAAGLEQQRAQTRALQEQTLALRQSAEANKPETFSYAQKKEFDVVQKNLASAKDAEDSATIADRAAPLITQAYGGKIEAGLKGLAGFAGISTQAKEANDRLAQLSQQLALKTPKFSGPTSDADAKRYDKAVGDLANPSITVESKTQALKDIKELAQKQADFAAQQENYYYSNNKSLRGFRYIPSENPFGK